ncbi:hypothetical protein AB5I39_14405 [Sphingomonas sp. MMS24-J45]|uniref:hypothetical protein n=1 Tax=Sphingomonas sp. MMS24-J45 TaxID=3238806 RepID=UPI00384DCD92
MITSEFVASASASENTVASKRVWNTPSIIAGEAGDTQKNFLSGETSQSGTNVGPS